MSLRLPFFGGSFLARESWARPHVEPLLHPQMLRLSDCSPSTLSVGGTEAPNICRVSTLLAPAASAGHRDLAEKTGARWPPKVVLVWLGIHNSKQGILLNVTNCNGAWAFLLTPIPLPSNYTSSAVPDHSAICLGTEDTSTQWKLPVLRAAIQCYKTVTRGDPRPG